MRQPYRATSKQWRSLKPAARAMRKGSTPAEEALWQAIRGGRRNDVKFRRQFVIGRFIVDFFAPKERLVVEVDGSIHDDREDADAQRDAVLCSAGVRVLRVKNEDVLLNLNGVLDKIAALCTESGHRQP